MFTRRHLQRLFTATLRARRADADAPLPIVTADAVLDLDAPHDRGRLLRDALADVERLLGLPAGGLRTESPVSIAGLHARIQATGIRALAFRASDAPERMDRTTATYADLRREAEVLARTFADRRRVLSFVPPDERFGFVAAVLLPDLLGVPVLDLAAGAPLRADELQPGDLVVGLPVHWRAIARAPLVLPADVVGLSSRAPRPSALHDDLRRRGLARLVDAYSTPETGLLGLRAQHGAPYRLLEPWMRDGDGVRGSDGRTYEPRGLRWTSDATFDVGAPFIPRHLRPPVTPPGRARRTTRTPSQDADHGDRLAAFSVRIDAAVEWLGASLARLGRRPTPTPAPMQPAFARRRR